MGAERGMTVGAREARFDRDARARNCEKGVMDRVGSRSFSSPETAKVGPGLIERFPSFWSSHGLGETEGPARRALSSYSSGLAALLRLAPVD